MQSDNATRAARLQKAFCALAFSVLISVFRCAIGSIPVTSSTGASRCNSLATTNGTLWPSSSAMIFRFQSSRYMKRHSFPPARVTNRNWPLISGSQDGLSASVAFRIPVSVNVKIPQDPEIPPPALGLYSATLDTGKRKSQHLLEFMAVNEMSSDGLRPVPGGQ